MAIMQVSRKVDYALRAVIHLANEEASDRACSVRRDRRARADPATVPREDRPGADPQGAGALAARSARRLRPGASGRPGDLPGRHRGRRGPDLAQRLRRGARRLLPPRGVRDEAGLARRAAAGAWISSKTRRSRTSAASGPGPGGAPAGAEFGSMVPRLNNGRENSPVRARIRLRYHRRARALETAMMKERDFGAEERMSRGLFQPDTLLPSQYFDRVRRRAHPDGERRLMIAVLEDAVDVYRKQAGARDARRQQLFHDAEEWIERRGSVAGSSRSRTSATSSASTVSTCGAGCTRLKEQARGRRATVVTLPRERRARKASGD